MRVSNGRRGTGCTVALQDVLGDGSGVGNERARTWIRVAGVGNRVRAESSFLCGTRCGILSTGVTLRIILRRRRAESCATGEVAGFRDPVRQFG